MDVYFDMAVTRWIAQCENCVHTHLVRIFMNHSSPYVSSIPLLPSPRCIHHVSHTTHHLFRHCTEIVLYNSLEISNERQCYPQRRIATVGRTNGGKCKLFGERAVFTNPPSRQVTSGREYHAHAHTNIHIFSHVNCVPGMNGTRASVERLKKHILLCPFVFIV